MSQVFTGIGIKIVGHLKIQEYEDYNAYRDGQHNRVLLDKRNAVHKENASVMIINGLTNRAFGNIAYMVLGNGGTSLDTFGNVVFLPPNDTGPNANLYNPVFFQLVDDELGSLAGNQMAARHIGNSFFTDVDIRCLIGVNQPFGQLPSNQSPVNLNTSTFAFDEIGLKLLDGTLITHVVFSPVLKTASSILEVIYTLRTFLRQPPAPTLIHLLGLEVLTELPEFTVQIIPPVLVDLIGEEATSEISISAVVGIDAFADLVGQEAVSAEGRFDIMYYFEVTIVDSGDAYSAAIGISNNTLILYNAVNDGIDNFTPIIASDGGLIYTNEGLVGWPTRTVGNPAGIAAGVTLGFVVDLATARMWVRDTAFPNTWAGGDEVGPARDPVAGTNGRPFDSSYDNIPGDIYITGGGGYELPQAPHLEWVLTNSNLTATTATINEVDTIIGVESNTSGQYYFEFTYGGGDETFGIAKSTQGNRARLIANSVGFERVYDGQNIWRVNGSPSVSGSPLYSLGVNDVIGIAIDLDLGLMWFRNTTGLFAPGEIGIWYGDAGTGDPASETNGKPFTPFAAAMFLAFCSDENGIAAATMNAGGSSFVLPAPSGFSPWNAADHWDPDFGQQPRYPTITLNPGTSPFVASIPSGCQPWDPVPGSTTWNPADNSYLTLSNGNLTLTGDNLPVPSTNQRIALCRSTSFKKQT